MKYCKHCGAQVRDEAIFCPACGCSTEDQTSFTNKNKESGLQIAAKIFMILSCALTAPGFFMDDNFRRLACRNTSFTALLASSHDDCVHKIIKRRQTACRHWI